MNITLVPIFCVLCSASIVLTAPTTEPSGYKLGSDLERGLHARKHERICQTLYQRFSYALWRQICSQSNNAVVGPFALRGGQQPDVIEKLEPVLSVKTSGDDYELFRHPTTFAAALNQLNKQIAELKNKFTDFDGFDESRLTEAGSDVDILHQLLDDRQKIPSADADERDVEHDLTNPLYLI